VVYYPEAGVVLTKQRVGRAGWAVLLLAVAVISSGCQGFAALDQPPVAKFTVTPNPDPLKALIRVGDLVTLDASPSSDPQGYDLSYEWTLTKPFQSTSRLSSTTGKTVTFYPDAENVIFLVSLQVTARVQSAQSRTTQILASSIDHTKARLTVVSDGNGSVEPSGFRPLSTGEILPIRAIAKKGYKFLGWVTEPTGAVVADAAMDSTTVTLSPGASSTVTATFVPTALPPSFLAWTTVPYGFVRVDGRAGTTKLLGGDLVMVAMTLSPTSQLYGVGDLLVPRGGLLYRLDGTGNSLSGTGISLRDGSGATVTVASLAFGPTGLLYFVEASGTHRVFSASLGSVTTNSTLPLTLVGTPVPELDSLAFAPETGILYGTDGYDLYTVDATRATAIKVGSFATTKLRLTSLTFARDGRLFGIDNGSSATSIYSIDPSKGTATLVVGLSTGLLSLLAEP